MSSMSREEALRNLIPEEHLQHYGVKGMKWGVRRDRDSSSSSKSSKPQKLSRKERKTAQREAERKADVAKANKLLESAQKDPDSLILLDAGYGRAIATGREFVTHLQNGGYLNPKMSEVFATKDPTTGKYVQNPDLGRRK